MKRLAMLVCVAAALTACGEKPQTLGAARTDAAPFQGTDNAFAAPGWTTVSARETAISGGSDAESATPPAREPTSTWLVAGTAING